MFSGLVQGTGKIISSSGGKLSVKPDFVVAEPLYGESIAINGCCLTLESFSDGVLTFHTMEESLRRTNLGRMSAGDPVNMERALRVGDRLGGHIVQGHVDVAAEVLECRRTADGDFRFSVSLPKKFAPLVVEKGSIAIDGVSLTVADVSEDAFSVRLIPVTLHDTALQYRHPGTLVNLEFDIVGRYILRMLETGRSDDDSDVGITMDTLREAGFL